MCAGHRKTVGTDLSALRRPKHVRGAFLDRGRNTMSSLHGGALIERGRGTNRILTNAFMRVSTEPGTIRCGVLGSML